MLAGRLGIPTPLPRRWRKMLSMSSTIRGLWLPDYTSRFVNETGAPELSVLLFFCFVFQAGVDVGHDVREENHPHLPKLRRRVLLQLSAKEILRRAIRPNPALPHEEPMNLIGEHEFLDVHFLGAQALQQIDRLREIDIAIVVSLDEQRRRPPGRDRRIR